MSDSIDVDPQELRRGASQLREVADQLQTRWAEFSGRVQAMGDIFGDDPVGGLIGASYQAAHGLAADSYQSVTTGLVGFSEGLAKMAGRYESADGSSREEFQRLGGA